MSGSGSDGRAVVLQKLLTGPQADAVVSRGWDQVGGMVVDAGAAVSLATPEQLLAAYGRSGAPEFVDVVRFVRPALSDLTVPADVGERQWPTFASGFLRGAAVVPVWELSRTRWSVGAEYWRIRADGAQKCLSVYTGAGRGWRGAQGWRPPSQLVGPRAQWRGLEWCADVDDADDSTGGVVTLVAFAQPPSGEHAHGVEWQQVRPEVWAARVSREECRVFEWRYTAWVRGVRVRVLEADGSSARVLLMTSDPVEADSIGADMVEPGMFEATVPMSALEQTEAAVAETAG